LSVINFLAVFSDGTSRIVPAQESRYRYRKYDAVKYVIKYSLYGHMDWRDANIAERVEHIRANLAIF
jgi:hypothetical protein